MTANLVLGSLPTAGLEKEVRWVRELVFRQGKQTILALPSVAG